MKIPLIKPFINQDIKNRVLDVLDREYLTEEPVTRAFLNILKKFTGCIYKFFYCYSAVQRKMFTNVKNN
jgi:dTDP-4-amino-4,6-dideoxygalactose transaminase